MDKEELVNKWLANELSESEKLEFQEHPDYEDLLKIDRSLHWFKAPDFDINEESKKLAEKKNKGRVIGLFQTSNLLKVAASVIVAMIIGLAIFIKNYTDKPETNTLYSHNKTVTYLPDSSMVRINKGTEISYSTSRWEEDRKVNLTGEAFFKVKKGSRFDVETNNGVVTVLGTEFNVNSRDSFFVVECYEGRVRVNTADQNIELSKGQIVKFINGQLDVKMSSTLQQAPLWVSGESDFEKTPCKFVFQELERQFDLSLSYETVNLGKSFTGSFPHDDLEVALKAVSIPLGLRYEIDETQKSVVFFDKED